MRLMIVDDHLGVRQLIRQFVATAQDTVCECASGDEAIRVAPEFKPDAVTMDVRMPGACGLTATRAIRAALPETRIIIVTSHDQPDLGHAAKEAGAAGFVLKDNLADLSTLLRNSAPQAFAGESNPAETPAAAVAAGVGSVTGRPRALLVLMVDSCANDCELASARLAADGFKPILERVQTREAFQRALDRGRWDLILTEHDLPMITGVEVIKTVRQRNLPVPVICLTGSFRPNHVDAMLKAGAAACVDKNSPQDLGEVVRQTLRSATGSNTQ